MRGGSQSQPGAAASAFRRSAVPGRERWEIAGLAGQPARAVALEDAFRGEPYIRSAHANAATGRVLVTYDPALTADVFARSFEPLIRRLAQSIAPRTSSAHERVGLRERVLGREHARLRPVSDDTPDAVTRLLAELRPYRAELTRAAGETMISLLASISRFAVVRFAIDLVVKGSVTILGRFTLTAGLPAFAMITIGGLALTALESTFDYRSRVRWRKVTLAYENDLRTRAFAHVEQLDLRYFEQANAGRVLAVLSDDVNQVSSIFNAANSLLRTSASAVLVSAALVALAPAVALWSLLPIPFVFLAIEELQQRLKPRLETTAGRQAELNARISSDVEGITTIKAFSAEARELALVDAASAGVRDAKLDAAEVSLLFGPVLEFIVMSGTLTTILTSQRLVAENKLTPGAFATMMMLAGQLLYPFMEIGPQLEQFQSGVTALERIYALLDIPIELVDGTQRLDAGTMRGEIAFDDVTFGYEPNRPVVANLSMRIPAGSTVAIVGPTGSGKTTLVKLLMRFYEGHAGRITLDDEPIAHVRVADLRSAIGLVSQEPYLFPGTIRENIVFGKPDAGDDAVRAAAAIAQALDFIDAEPQGLDALVGERGAKLSGGQRQRLSIARALVKEPRILVLDEATSAVDNETEARFFRDLRAALRRTTTIIIAHRLSTIRNADRIFVVRDGRIVEEGTHDELVQLDGTYAAALRFGTLGMDAFSDGR